MINKLVLSHDLPMDQVKQLSSSGARTGSQVSHSQTKIKASFCLATFFVFFCFVISAGQGSCLVMSLLIDIHKRILGIQGQIISQIKSVPKLGEERYC